MPLPRPRPIEAFASTPDALDKKTPASPSACQTSITEQIAIAPIVPPIQELGGCGGEDLVRLEFYCSSKWCTGACEACCYRALSASKSAR